MSAKPHYACDKRDRLTSGYPVAIQRSDLAPHLSGKRNHIVELRVSGPLGATNEGESEDDEVPPITDERGSFMFGFKKTG